jgi:hypothetical protein
VADGRGVASRSSNSNRVTWHRDSGATCDRQCTELLEIAQNETIRDAEIEQKTYESLAQNRKYLHWVLAQTDT